MNKNTKQTQSPYICHSDAFGNMPCDNGVLCDKCLCMDVTIINNYDETIDLLEEDDYD